MTGVAGPGGGTPEKPVGLVFLHVEGPSGGRGLRFELPGDRDRDSRRATALVLHLAPALLSQSGDSSW